MPSPRRTRSGKLRPSPIKQEVPTTLVDAGRAEEQEPWSRLEERGEGSILEVLRGSNPRLLASTAAVGEVAEERGSRHEVVDISDTEDVEEHFVPSGGGNETAGDVVVLDVTVEPAAGSDESVIDLTDVEEVRGTGVRRDEVSAARRQEVQGARSQEVQGARSQEVQGARSQEVQGAGARRDEVQGARRQEVLGAVARRGEVRGAGARRAEVLGPGARRDAVLGAVGGTEEVRGAGARREEVVVVEEAGSLSPLRLGARLGTCLSTTVGPSSCSTPAGPSGSSVDIVDRLSTPAGPSSSSVDIVDLTDSPAPSAPVSPPDAQPAGLVQCPVCMDSLQELSADRHALTTRCGHLFCSTCLPTAIRASGRCPTCRKKIKAKDSLKIFL